jgi:hypothetical protein
MGIKEMVAFYFVGDMERAQSLYSALLRIEPNCTSAEWTDFRVGGARFALHLRAVLPEVSGVATVQYGAIVSLEVSDIQDAVRRAPKITRVNADEIRSKRFPTIVPVHPCVGFRRVARTAGLAQGYEDKNYGVPERRRAAMRSE